MSFFEKITDGLLLYEILLMIFGSLMFIVMLVLIIIFASQKRPLKSLLLFFIVPVLLLVWPSVQKVQIDAKGLALEKYSRDTTTESKKEVRKILYDLENRNIKDPAIIKNIASAQYTIGNDAAAEKTIEKLDPADTTDTKIRNIKAGIFATRQLHDQIVKVNSNPADTAALRKLNLIKIKAASLPLKNVQLKENISAANKKVMTYNLKTPVKNILSQPRRE